MKTVTATMITEISVRLTEYCTATATVRGARERSVKAVRLGIQHA